MASEHKKAFVVCENKSLVPAYGKDQVDEIVTELEDKIAKGAALTEIPNDSSGGWIIDVGRYKLRMDKALPSSGAVGFYLQIKLAFRVGTVGHVYSELNTTIKIDETKLTEEDRGRLTHTLEITSCEKQQIAGSYYRIVTHYRLNDGKDIENIAGPLTASISQARSSAIKVINDSSSNQHVVSVAKVNDSNVTITPEKVFIRYADNDQGLNMSETYSGQRYMGIYTGVTASSSPSDYTWMYIGTDTDTDYNTWRPIQVNDTQILGSGTDTGALNLKSGANITLTNTGGTVVIAANNTTYTWDSLPGKPTSFNPATHSHSIADIPYLQHELDRIPSSQRVEAWNTFISKYPGDFKDLTNEVNTKQEKLISGTNIKTINGTPILGSGNIEIQGGGVGGDPYRLPIASRTILGGVKAQNKSVNDTQKVSVDSDGFLYYAPTDISGKQDKLTAGTGIQISGNTISASGSSLSLGETSTTAYAGNKGKQNADNIANLQQSVTNLTTSKQDKLVAGDGISISGTTISATGSGSSGLQLGETSTTAYAGDKGKQNAENIATLQTKVTSLENTKQEKLISGTNIKTINGTPILGSGNIEIQGGGLTEIPKATTTTLGGIKVGNGLKIDTQGTLSIDVATNAEIDALFN